jgi:hypothetical protein
VLHCTEVSLQFTGMGQLRRFERAPRRPLFTLKAEIRLRCNI